MKKDVLGDRMKSFYEDRTRYYLPRNSFALIRVDGKAFHTFTKGLERPFDDSLMGAMDTTAIALCSKIQGAKFAYVQSDEISIVLTDFDTLKTDAWFDYNIQKMCSVSASIATKAFNNFWIQEFMCNTIHESYPPNTQVLSQTIPDLLPENPDRFYAEFDARVWSMSYHEEVLNYFLWRQQDATRNSVQSVAQSMFSHKVLHGKNTNDLKAMIAAKGKPWDDYTIGEQRGRIIIKESYEKNGAARSRWVAENAYDFLDQKNKLKELLP